MSVIITKEQIADYITFQLSVDDFGYLVIPDDDRLNSEAASVIKAKFKAFQAEQLKGID